MPVMTVQKARRTYYRYYLLCGETNKGTVYANNESDLKRKVTMFFNENGYTLEGAELIIHGVIPVGFSGSHKYTHYYKRINNKWEYRYSMSC